ncbi:hypothetical protein EniLVp02_0176 [Vibrio phage EniLVp02]
MTPDRLKCRPGFIQYLNLTTTMGSLFYAYIGMTRRSVDCIKRVHQIMNFLNFSEQYDQYLEEALITFNRRAYPRFGHVVILAGGAGSGKGFTLERLLGIDGKVLDVDALKALAIASTKFAARVFDETGKNLKSMDLRKPENVSELHSLLSDVYGTIPKQQQTLFKSIAVADEKRKPNLIFDVTLKDLAKLRKISSDVEKLGYDKRNIHIVWVANDVKVAIKQNQERSRVVPHKILVATHKGAAETMSSILKMGNALRQYMDGDIWIAFNKRGVDGTIVKSDSGGSYISASNYIKVKESGKPVKNEGAIEDEVFAKIKKYIPASADFQQ